MRGLGGCYHPGFAERRRGGMWVRVPPAGFERFAALLVVQANPCKCGGLTAMSPILDH